MQTVVIMHGTGYMRIPIIFRILIALHHTLPSRTSYHEIKKPLSDDFLAEYCLKTNNLGYLKIDQQRSVYGNK